MQQLRRLLGRADVMALLQLSESQVQWLISTQQLRTLVVCGTERIDSRDVDQLIDTYKQVAARKEHHVV